MPNLWEYNKIAMHMLKECVLHTLGTRKSSNIKDFLRFYRKQGDAAGSHVWRIW